MKKPLLLFLLFFSALTHAQYRTDYGFYVGRANYLGDIGNGPADRRDFIYDMQTRKTNMAFGLFMREQAIYKLGIRESLTMVQISGEDRLTVSPGRRNRNLNFRNTIIEFALIGEFYFWEMNDVGGSGRNYKDFKTYIFGGAAVFYHNPQAQMDNKWYNLRPLRTEGQVAPYNKFCLAIPLGIGFYYTINRKTRITWDLGWRITFTDYLDDISGNYADPKDIPTDLGRKLANRAGEQNTPLYIPEPGDKRGDPTHKDHYLYSSIGIGRVISKDGKVYKLSRGYLFDWRKYNKRRIRAKF